DLDGAVIGSKVDGAVEETDEGLPHAREIGKEGTWNRRQAERKRNRFLARVLGRMHSLIDALLRVDGRQLQPQIPREKAPRIHHLIDQLELLLRLTNDRLAGPDVAIS